MKTWLLLVCLVQSELVYGKRFDPAMVDPLMRRSSLDKNFMRFGRSSPSFTEEEDLEESHGSSAVTEANKEAKEDSFLRSSRGKDNFIRFGRARNDNFMRFGRGKQDSFMRFGKARNDNFMRFGKGVKDNYMRFGRGKQDSFMRFGRGKQDSFMRFGKGGQDNYMRFGRGKHDNFMRFGRGKLDNFMRFGRGKQDNFMRFGRDFESVEEPTGSVIGDANNINDDMLRSNRGKQDSFMRFGKGLEGNSEVVEQIAIRSDSNEVPDNLIRLARERNDNFMRFGKSSNKHTNADIKFDDEIKGKDSSDYVATYSGEGFTRESKSKDSNLVRYGRHPPNKNDGFMRFGRNIDDTLEDNSSDNVLIPPRLKRSLMQSEIPPNDYQNAVQGFHQVTMPLVSFLEDQETEYMRPTNTEEYSNRRKRSFIHQFSTLPPFIDEDSSEVDYVTTKLRFNTSTNPEYESSLISAGLPNVIVGPEFSFLPDLDPPSNMLKRGRPGDQNFLRLG